MARCSACRWARRPDAAAKAARKAAHEQKKPERYDKNEDRVNAPKAKFQRD